MVLGDTGTGFSANTTLPSMVGGFWSGIILAVNRGKCKRLEDVVQLTFLTRQLKTQAPHNWA